ncbi:7422_t:CDS:2 [Paraglomus occultum]|uniref:7422_t:CDS:1 n=1 Tax=Paraglomus occultum TaxID=144539 RepID=A0A9N8ZAF3_9GLOM|nr:7422_t:CDS:2 [Paraglomus occultum]
MHDNQPPNNRQKPGFATSFLYKLTELAAYTSAVASEAYKTITGPPEKQQGSPHHEYPEYYGDVMQIRAAAEEDSEIMNVDKRNVWDAVNNVDEEEPPPPYDNSWRMPSPSTQNLPSTMDASSPSRVQFNTPQPQSRRRQIRICRGNRRPLRRKSSSQDLRDNTTKFDDEDDLFSKFSGKLADMVAEGKAALTSTVDVTEVEMMMAEEREREEKIRRDLGIQAPISRRRRTGSSSSDGDYFSAAHYDNTYGSPNSVSDYNYSSLTSSPISYTSSGFSGLNSSSPASAYSAYSNSYSSSPGKFDRIAGSSLGSRSYSSSTGAYGELTYGESRQYIE